MINLSPHKLIIFIIIIVFTYFCVRAFFIEPNALIINRQTFNLPNWHNEHKNLKISIISDLHAGAPYIREAKIKKIVEISNNEKPDIVFLMGDYVTQKVLGGRFIPPDVVIGILAGLKAKYGVIAILGNHDWWYNGQKITKLFENNGITVLENNVKKLSINDKTLWIAGLADLTTRFPNIDSTLTKVTDNNPIILLSHNPDVFPFVPERVSLTISGHTHGGQVVLPILGRLIVPSAFGQRYAKGYIVENHKHFFVSSGIGTSEIPIRLGLLPEIVVLTLK